MKTFWGGTASFVGATKAPIVILVSLTLACLLPGTGVLGAQSMGSLAEARSLLAAGDVDGALERLEAILLRSPDSAEARFLMGLALLDAGLNPESERIFELLSLEYPESLKSANNLAVVLGEQAQVEAAIEVLELAIAGHREFGIAYNNLRVLYGLRAGASYERAVGEAGDGEPAGLRVFREWDRAPAVDEVAKDEVPTPSVDRAENPVAHTVASGSQDPEDPKWAAEMFVLAWARSWTSRSIGQHLAFYSDGFRPSSGQSYETWAAQLGRQMRSAQFIDVTLDGLTVSMVGDRAIASFRQNYRSDSVAESTTRNLLLEIDPATGSWVIVEERSR